MKSGDLFRTAILYAAVSEGPDNWLGGDRWILVRLPMPERLDKTLDKACETLNAHNERSELDTALFTELIVAGLKAISTQFKPSDIEELVNLSREAREV